MTENKLLVFTINVGSLPPFKVEAFMERMKDHFRKDQKIDTDTKCLFLPTRDGQSKVEVYGGDSSIYDKIDPSEIWEIKRRDKWTPNKRQVCDHVLTMLGAPVIKIELDEQQLDLCYDSVLNTMKMSFKTEGDAFLVSCAKQADQTFKDGVLAYATFVLGRIRNVYNDPSSKLETGKQLMKEGNDRIAAWREDLINL